MITRKNQSIALVGAIFVGLGNAEIGQAIVTVENPENYRVAPGDFSGVVSLNNSQNPEEVPAYCTGSLLKGGLYLLTAAHCIKREDGGSLYIDRINNTTANFNLSTGFVSRPVVDFFIHPEYDGNLLNGNDVSVLQLGEPAPIEAQQYDIYSGTDEVGQIFTKLGYGAIGTGNTGEDLNSNLPGSLGYSGKNQFDASGDMFAGLPLFDGLVPNSQLLYDFDNGEAENDAFGVHFGINDLGLGINEVNQGAGDSGGPIFIDNSIAGITSYQLGDWEVFTNGSQTDIDSRLNGTFGEFAGAARASSYASFVEDAIAGKVRSVKSVPEPSPSYVVWIIVSAGGATFLGKHKRAVLRKIQKKN